MSETEKRRRLNFFIELITQNQKSLDSYSTRPQIYQQVLSDLREIEKEAPGLLPEYSGIEERSAVGDIYTKSLHHYLSNVLMRLKFERGPQGDEPEPVTEQRDFSFMKDAGLRTIVRRDYPELQRAYSAGCWKSVVILAGGTIEAITLDLLMSNHTAAKAAKSAEAHQDLYRWNLSSLINVAVECGLLTKSVEKLSHSVREFRNLVHPGNEIRSGFTFGKEEARIALEVLNLIQRELSS